MEEKKEVENFIDRLDIEADACDEIGSTFSASCMREEAERLRGLLKRRIIPKKIA